MTGLALPASIHSETALWMIVTLRAPYDAPAEDSNAPHVASAAPVQLGTGADDD